MSIDKRNLAVYLDELDDDPLSACEIACGLGFKHICLRRVWATNIGRVTDDACKQLVAAIRRAKLSVLAICTDDGRVPAEQLNFDEATKRSLLIASYFKAKFFRPYLGITTTRLPNQEETILAHINSWMDAIGGECARSAITPIFEIDPGGHLYEPADIATLLERHRLWKLLYDPSLLIAQRNQNPLIRYWYLLKDLVAAVDLHDFKQGAGFVPAGSGDCFLPATVSDCIANGYDGWFIVEPGVTRRTHPSANRKEIAQVVIRNFTQMVVDAQKTVVSRAATTDSATGVKYAKKRT